jgi:S-formylglutathione hydrolase FrmB
MRSLMGVGTVVLLTMALLGCPPTQAADEKAPTAAVEKTAPAPEKTAPAKDAKAPAADVKTPAATNAAVKDKITVDGASGTKVEEFKLTSPEMKRDIDVVVILPPAYFADSAKRFPVLYTLHGRGAPFRVFKEMTTVHKAIVDQPMIVVGFNGDTAGWYLDSSEKPESQFITFFFKTLIPTMDKEYRTDEKKRAVTGFSMGGFGAFHYMLLQPTMFASASSMSGAFEPAAIGWVKKDFTALLGDESKNAAGYALLDLAARFKAAVGQKAKLPPLLITCGTEDGLMATNQKMRDLMKTWKLTAEYLEGPGKHDFVYWKGAATAVIDFHWRTFQDGYKPIEHPKAEAKPAAVPAK